MLQRLRAGCRLIGIALAAAFAMFQAGALQSQQDIEDATGDPGVVDSPEERLRQQFEELLRALNENRLNFATDSIMDAANKRAVVDAVLRAHSDEILSTFFDADVYVFDYVAMRNFTSPRLSGRVLRVGAGEEYAELEAAMADLQPGDLVLLGPGHHRLVPLNGRSGAGSLVDVAFVGEGHEHTTLATGELDSAQRVRIEGVRIECENSSITDFRSLSGLHLRDCLITGYASGDAIYGSGGSAFLVERCIFDGASGRGAGMGGAAFDLRGGDYFLHVRQTQFVDNRQIAHAVTGPMVFDGCISTGEGQGIPAYGGEPTLWLREDSATSVPTDALYVVPFTQATDDPEVVRFLAGDSISIDEPTLTTVRTLELHRNLGYWIGLLRHDNPEVRRMAADRLNQLCGEEANPSADGAVEGERLADLGALFRAEQEFTRLLDWYERVKFEIVWDEGQQAYIVPARAPVAINADGTGYDDATSARDALLAALEAHDWRAFVTCLAPPFREQLTSMVGGRMVFFAMQSNAPTSVVEILEDHGITKADVQHLVDRANTFPDPNARLMAAYDLLQKIPDREAFLADFFARILSADSMRPRFDDAHMFDETLSGTLVVGMRRWPVVIQPTEGHWFIEDGDGNTFLRFVGDEAMALYRR